MYTEVVWVSVYDPGVYNFSYMCIRRVATFGNFFVTEHFQRKCLETEKETFFILNIALLVPTYIYPLILFSVGRILEFYLYIILSS